MNDLMNLELVQEMLDLSSQYNLTAECILTAINLSKQHPNMSVAAVLMCSLNEWDCIPVHECE